MSKLTLEEAISHCLEVVEKNEQAKKDGNLWIDTEYEDCCADHRQLAEWLQELKEAKRLLKAAVEDINFYVDCYEAHCDECCCDHDNHCHWKHEAEALKLIGGTDND